MADTLHAMAGALGVEPLPVGAQGLLLDVARDVAHSTERRYAPLAAFLLGAAVASGLDLDEAVNRLRAELPDAADPPES